MPSQKDRIIRIACMVLGALLAYRIVMILFRPDPLSRIKVPEIPKWMPTNAIASANTNSNVGTTNPAVAKSNTNSSSAGTNLQARVQTNQLAGTNPPIGVATNASVGTNIISGTNSNTALTNLATSTTNSPGKPATNAMGGTPPPGMPRGMRGGMMPGMPGMPGMGPRIPLPPLEQARVDKIVQSELLAPVIRPQPMALLGIAGLDAFIRTPNGQKVILREGGTADGLKVLRIGTNRVLVELAGETKELMIFAGRGGESLLPKTPTTNAVMNTATNAATNSITPGPKL